MRLAPGSSIGAFRIAELLGAGGMGEVYRARDTKLGRDVAIKVLPDTVAADAERLGRFAREATTLASLNHPHVAQVYGFEEATLADGGSVRALVMELVDGEDLARRLERGPLAVDDALAIARQVADALEAAHEQGIVHRDLKPANVMIGRNGHVKVLDFGLAKPVAASTGAGAAALTHSPTALSLDGPEKGVLLGTAAYMSPEQARGREVDRRTDIWAFGCVLYEMLAGRAAFAAGTTLETIARVIEARIDSTRLPAATPPNVRRLLERCLSKDPRQRLRDIGDARLELEDAATLRPAVAAAPDRRPA